MGGLNVSRTLHVWFCSPLSTCAERASYLEGVRTEAHVSPRRPRQGVSAADPILQPFAATAAVTIGPAETAVVVTAGRLQGRPELARNPPNPLGGGPRTPSPLSFVKVPSGGLYRPQAFPPSPGAACPRASTRRSSGRCSTRCTCTAPRPAAPRPRRRASCSARCWWTRLGPHPVVCRPGPGCGGGPGPCCAEPRGRGVTGVGFRSWWLPFAFGDREHSARKEKRAWAGCSGVTLGTQGRASGSPWRSCQASARLGCAQLCKHKKKLPLSCSIGSQRMPMLA